jgi:hypothetical protein
VEAGCGKSDQVDAAGAAVAIRVIASHTMANAMSVPLTSAVRNAVVEIPASRPLWPIAPFVMRCTLLIRSPDESMVRCL